jgi:predicted NBD/HSP70 family sugar kinase
MKQSVAGIQKSLAEVILLVRKHEKSSRRDVSNMMKISPSTSGFYTDWLMNKNLVIEVGSDQGLMGRPKRSIQLNPRAGWFAGIEFHGSALYAVKVNFAGQLEDHIKIQLSIGLRAEEVIQKIIFAIVTLQNRSDDPLLSIGVGAPGVINPVTGHSSDYQYFSEWQNVAISKPLESYFKVPTYVDHNLRAIALAEEYFGEANQMRDYLCIVIRSGIGIGIVVDGDVIQGHRYGAGQLGHMPFLGKKGEVQDYLSAPAVYRRLTNATEEDPIPENIREIFKNLAKEIKDPILLSEPWESLVEELAVICATSISMLDPQMVFVYGPLSEFGDVFYAALNQRVKSYFSATSKQQVPMILATKLMANAGALGAAGLAMNQWSPEYKGKETASL